MATGLLLEAQKCQKVTYDHRRDKEPVFAMGDKVYLSTENLIPDEGSKKLSDLRTGPFTVLGKIGDGAYKIDLPDHMRVNPVFNVSLLTRANPDPILGRAPAEPAPIIVDGQESLEDYEQEFFTVHPTAKRHTDVERIRTKGKRSLKRK